MANNGRYLTAYDLARNHGFTGTEDDWYNLLVKGWTELQNHEKLINRFEPDQHNIASISGLQAKLTDLEVRIQRLEEK